MTAPNIFEYATKELSQDAFVCWLLAWSDSKFAGEDVNLNKAARAFLDGILAVHGVRIADESISIKVTRQDLSIDIVAIINEEYCLLIEDKTFTSEHSGQLRRYADAAIGKYPHLKLLPTYLKTGEQSRYHAVTADGYKLFLRRNMLDALSQGLNHGVTNSIFIDYFKYLSSRDGMFNAYASKEVAEWIESPFAWSGFYEELQRRSAEVEWSYVANPNGGFLAAWWGAGNWEGSDVYLQIEQGKLCLKIGVFPGADCAERRDALHRKIMHAASKVGDTKIARPKRFGNGATMTVAVVERNDWMISNIDGMLDMDATMQRLREVESIFVLACSPSSEHEAGY